MPPFNSKHFIEGCHKARESGKALTALLLLASCFAVLASGVKAQVVSARAGVVCHVDGEVWYHAHSSKGGGVQQLEVGTELNNGDFVITSDKGLAEWSLNPDSYLKVAANSHVLAQETNLDRMRFDIKRGEVLINIRAFNNGASLVLHTPPGLLTVYKPGRYLIRVAEGGETEAIVGKGELRYKDKNGKLTSVKEGRRVYFYKEERIDNGAQPRPNSSQSK